MTGTASAKADIGVTGLAVMGSNLARNFARNGFVTAVHNRSYAKTAALIEEHGNEGVFVPSESTADFVASLAVPRKILISSGRSTRPPGPRSWMWWWTRRG